MLIPEDIEIIETPIAVNWLDEHGVICSISKSGNQSIDEFEEHFAELVKLGQNKKRPFLIDPTLARPLKIEERKYLNEKLTSIMSCAAFITENKMMKIGVNIYFRIRPTEIPMKMFSEFEEAQEWLLEQIKNNPALIG